MDQHQHRLQKLFVTLHPAPHHRPTVSLLIGDTVFLDSYTSGPSLTGFFQRASWFQGPSHITTQPCSTSLLDGPWLSYPLSLHGRWAASSSDDCARGCVNSCPSRPTPRFPSQQRCRRVRPLPLLANTRFPLFERSRPLGREVTCPGFGPIPLVITDTEQLFTSLWDVHLPPLEECLFKYLTHAFNQTVSLMAEL